MLVAPQPNQSGIGLARRSSTAAFPYICRSRVLSNRNAIVETQFLGSGWGAAQVKVLGFQFKMSVMGEAESSPVTRLTRNRWPSEDTAYCCFWAEASRGPSRMRTGKRAAGVPASSDWPSGDNFTEAAIILLSSDR
jgi:hypothetical protein